MHANKDQPVVIENRFLLTALHYQGGHSNYYNAVDLKENYKSILVQINRQLISIASVNYQEDQLLVNITFKLVVETNGTQDKMNRFSKIVPIPRIYQLGNLHVQEMNYHYVIWQKTGPSLKLCFKLMKKKLSIKTIALIALKMITVLQQLHSQNVLHRCLKLSCIMTTKKSELLVTNLDQYTEFLNRDGKFSTKSKQIPIKINKFSSIGQHLQQVPSPRDDLESLGYIILYLLTQGKLPPPSQSKEQVAKDKFYMEFKRNLLPEKVLRDFPETFFHYFYNVLKLGIKEIPNYELLKQPFVQFLGKNDFDFKFEWLEIIEQQKDQTRTTDPTIRDKSQTQQTIIMPQFISELEKGNQSAPTSPKQQKKKSKFYTEDQMNIPMAPILEKNESVTTKNVYDSNAGSPRFRFEVDNIMMDLCHSSSGEVSPTKDDDPIIYKLPSFKQHDNKIL